MDKFAKRGIATAGLVGVLSLALLVGVGAFALYSMQTSRTSTDSQADDGSPGNSCYSDSSCVKRGGERGKCVNGRCVYSDNTGDSSKVANLGLKVVPTLADELGKINLAVSWNSISDPKFDHFLVAVRDSSGRLVSAKEEKDVGNATSTSFSNLPAVNGDYKVRLTAVYKNKTNNKVQALTIGYFEDQFSNFDSGRWGKFCKDGTVMIGDTGLKLTAEGTIGKKGLCNVRLKEVVRGDFESAVEFVNFDLPATFDNFRLVWVK